MWNPQNLLKEKNIILGCGLKTTFDQSKVTSWAEVLDSSCILEVTTYDGHKSNFCNTTKMFLLFSYREELLSPFYIM